MSYKDYSSLYINLGIFKAKIQMLFISYRNLVLETKFNFTYEFGYQTSTFKVKIQSYSCYLKILFSSRSQSMTLQKLFELRLQVTG